jgi:transcriptional regulator with XRE-family HTH domain
MLIPDAKAWKRPTTEQEQKEAGAKLQALLDDAMLTQTEAADLIGVNHRTMRRYVLGQTAYPYSVWFAMVMLQEQKAAERPNPSILRKLTREELDRELDKWRAEQSRCSNASRAYARAAEHLRAVFDELVRRDDKRHDARAMPPQRAQVPESQREDASARRREGAIKAWSDPAFRAGASERALKAAATRRLRKQSQQPD